MRSCGQAPWDAGATSTMPGGYGGEAGPVRPTGPMGNPAGMETFKSYLEVR